MFLLGRGDLCNGMYNETGAVNHMSYQMLVKNIAKAEFVLGVMAKIADTINIGQFQHVQEKIAETAMTMEMLKAFQRASEEDATVSRWGGRGLVHPGPVGVPSGILLAEHESPLAPTAL